ncbi:NAD(P)-dependent oxidoreductase [Ectobacillus sp. sgz5001026]|uniref:NAD(P)-dependent oxidoreductase n=1 Tax=Ectobacillus sp. sgz5001026 TaxID=3242473 RepID=UPI0036D427E6
MHIALYGATGRVGSELLRLLLADGHSVTALVRDKTACILHDHMSIIEGDVLHQRDVFRSMKGCDVVLSALNTEGGSTLSTSMPYIVESMKREGITRIVTIGTAGILQARSNPSLYRYESSESRRTSSRAAIDHRKAYETVKQSAVDWTIVCPTHLIDGRATYTYRVEEEVLPLGGTTITVGDTAHFAYEVLMKSSFHLTRVGISY